MSLRNPISFDNHRAVTLSFTSPGSRGVQGPNQGDNPEPGVPTDPTPIPKPDPSPTMVPPPKAGTPAGEIDPAIFLANMGININESKPGTVTSPEEAREKFQKGGLDDSTFEKFFEVVQDENGGYKVQPKAPFEFEQQEWGMINHIYLVDPESGVKVTIDTNLHYSMDPSIENRDFKDYITYTDSNGNELNNDGTIDKDVIDKSTIEGYQYHTEVTETGVVEEEIMENLKAKAEELINNPEFVADLKAQYQATLVFEGKTYNEAEFNKLFQEAFDATFNGITWLTPMPGNPLDNGASLQGGFVVRDLVDIFMAEFTNTAAPQSVKDQKVLDKGGYISYNISQLEGMGEQFINDFFITYELTGEDAKRYKDPTMCVLREPYTAFEVREQFNLSTGERSAYCTLTKADGSNDIFVQQADGTYINIKDLEVADKFPDRVGNDNSYDYDKPVRPAPSQYDIGKLPKEVLDKYFTAPTNDTDNTGNFGDDPEPQLYPGIKKLYTNGPIIGGGQFFEGLNYTLKEPYTDCWNVSGVGDTEVWTFEYQDENGDTISETITVLADGSYIDGELNLTTATQTMIDNYDKNLTTAEFEYKYPYSELSEQVIESFFEQKEIPEGLDKYFDEVRYGLKGDYTDVKIEQGPGETKEITFYYEKGGDIVETVIVQANDGSWKLKGSISKDDKAAIEAYDNLPTVDAMEKHGLPQGLVDTLFELQDAPAGYENYFDDTQRYALKSPYINYTVSPSKTDDTTLVSLSYMDTNGIVQNRDILVYPDGTYEMTNDTGAQIFSVTDEPVSPNIVYENGIPHEII